MTNPKDDDSPPMFIEFPGHVPYRGGTVPMPTRSGEPGRVPPMQFIKDDPVELFNLWYRDPLKKLGRDGGFIALAISCLLYERYADALRVDVDRDADCEEFRARQLAADLGLSPEVAGKFWDVMRNGLLHQAMPKGRDRGEKASSWELSGEFKVPIRFDARAKLLEVEPLLFRDRVLDLYAKRPDVIAANKSFLWGAIYWRQPSP